VEGSNSCVGTLIFGSFFFIAFCQSFFPFFPPLFAFFFLLSVLLSFLFLSNWFLFLSSFVFPLLFRYCFIPVSLAHVVSSLAYPNFLGTKRLGCCYCCVTIIDRLLSLFIESKDYKYVITPSEKGKRKNIFVSGFLKELGVPLVPPPPLL
jgi:hypothetical protein